MKVFVGLIATLVASATAMYSPSDDVIDLTPANFNEQVINSDELWIVEFYAPWCGHCQQLTPEYKKAAMALRGVVKLGAVNADDHKSLGGQYGVRGFPTLKVFGANKNNPTDYQGARTAQGIVDSAMSTVRSMVTDRMAGRGGSSKKKSGGGGGGSGGGGKKGDPKDVFELTDSNFEELVLDSSDLWLVEFFAPWCGHCKTLAPHWAEAASELKGKVKLGALDATVHTVMASRYGIQSYPTILHFAKGSKADGIFEVYDGERATEGIVHYANEKLSENAPPPEIIQVQGYPTIKVFAAGSKDGETSDYDGGRTANDIIAWAKDKVAENIPPPEIVQITNEAAMTTACEEHQLCVFSFLPHILDCQSECRNNYLAILSKLADKYKKKQWGWIWAEAGTQPNAEEAFGIGGFGYPAMAAANSRKMKYAWLRGAFSEEGINEFLRELSFGRGSTAPIKNAKLPDIQDIEAWDGNDAELPVEEEWDLSDVELDDLDDQKVEL